MGEGFKRKPDAIPLNQLIGTKTPEDYLPRKIPTTRAGLLAMRKIQRAFSHGHADEKLILKAKKMTFDRPPHILDSLWDGTVKNVSKPAPPPALDFICYMRAWGMSYVEIGKSVDTDKDTISARLNKPDAKEKIKELRDKIFGGDPIKAIKNLVPNAIGRVADTMNDEAVRAATRLTAAQDILDRGLGKAVQKVAIEENSMRKVLESLDQIKKMGNLEDIIDVECMEIKSPEDKEKKKELVELDAADQWIKENLG